MGTCVLAIGWLVRWLWRWLGWSWVVFVQRYDNDVAVLKPPDSLPVSIGLNTDGTVSVTIGHGDAGDALLTELRSLVG